MSVHVHITDKNQEIVFSEAHACLIFLAIGEGNSSLNLQELGTIEIKPLSTVPIDRGKFWVEYLQNSIFGEVATFYQKDGKPCFKCKTSVGYYKLVMLLQALRYSWEYPEFVDNVEKSGDFIGSMREYLNEVPFMLTNHSLLRSEHFRKYSDEELWEAYQAVFKSVGDIDIANFNYNYLLDKVTNVLKTNRCKT